MHSPAITLGLIAFFTGVGSGVMMAFTGRYEFPLVGLGFCFGILVALLVYEVNRS